MRCTLSFALIPSAVMAIRASRSASNRNPDANIELGYSEGRLGVFKITSICNMLLISAFNVNEHDVEQLL